MRLPDNTGVAGLIWGKGRHSPQWLSTSGITSSESLIRDHGLLELHEDVHLRPEAPL